MLVRWHNLLLYDNSGVSIDEALDELTRNRSKLYDPQAVDACVKIFRGKELSFPGR